MANGTRHPTTTAGGAGRSDEALQRAVYALNNQNPSEAQRIAGDILKTEPRHAQALYVLASAAQVLLQYEVIQVEKSLFD